ncbi:NAD(P)/FAD-dependent oxidoreductase [Dactylosporangium sp. AC04546]|uniref:FAD-dependent oxidoreductase n=1 Tax=Dactylosporangium sp. AC04546 TaxID=2862460 RepID=UPI001EE0EDAA|nr:NAD(P)/FAD-dependent oxidoreductase [Dactylosporangium sp. AC04546]WVK89015.1 NAD(P)/FAD-dependent oxidoreductase [Dactylosporangium sp. AC04546]
MTRHAEIVGGGIGGLGLANCLAQRGWTVQLHERGAEIREVGAGLYLRNNPLSVLEKLGLFGAVAKTGLPLDIERRCDRHGRTRHQQRSVGDQRMWALRREDLIRALEKGARDAGVVIRTNSKIVQATGDGTVVSEDGSTFRGDLVVGADGYHSSVRKSLNLTKTYRQLPSVATRYIIPGREFEPIARTTMHWSGRRRVGVTPTSSDATYIFLISPEDDAEGVSYPIDVVSWSSSFPALTGLFQRIAETPSEPLQHNYMVVEATRWSSGSAAILGDAAHGLPPLLGQGAGLALSNAWALAHTLDQVPAVPDALARWERTYRNYADLTQKWSVRLDTLTWKWPTPLLAAREPVLHAIQTLPWWEREMHIADRFPIAA